MAEAKTIRYQVVITGNVEWVYLYRKPATQTTQASNQFSAIRLGSVVIATKISPDQKYYYLPYQNAWVSATNVNIVSMDPDPSLEDTDVKYIKPASQFSWDVNTRASDAYYSSSTTTDENGLEEDRFNWEVKTEPSDAYYSKRKENKEGVQNEGFDWNVQTTPSDAYYSTPIIEDEDTQKRDENGLEDNKFDWDVDTTPSDAYYKTEGYKGAGDYVYIRNGEEDPQSASGLTGPTSLYNKKTINDTPVSAKSKGTRSSGARLGKLDQSKLSGVFGIPYQFSNMVDRRVNDATGTSYGLGRKYIDKIVARNNLLYLTPGVQDFMTGAKPDDRAKILTALEDKVLGNTPYLDGVEKYSRYYTMNYAVSDYYKYVDAMCAATADLMGIYYESAWINGEYKQIGTYAWANARNAFKSLFFSNDAVVFYVDGLNSISESFSNDTRESSLASSVNGLSDEAKELNFITKKPLGADGGIADIAEGLGSAAESLVSGFLNGKGVLSGIMGNTTTLLNGGKIVFPEMWADSSYDRSYSINIKLRSPEADPVSIFLNIIVPYIHLICLTAPRDFSKSNESNSYIEPFLVRATFNGMFCIEMGLITDLSSDKGGEGTWSMDGLPTQLDISLTIKDLYKSLYLSSGTNRFVGNDGLMDFLMTTAGIALNAPKLSRQAAVYKAVIEHKLTNIPYRVGLDIRDGLTNMMRNVFGL